MSEIKTNPSPLKRAIRAAYSARNHVLTFRPTDFGVRITSQPASDYAGFGKRFAGYESDYKLENRILLKRDAATNTFLFFYALPKKARAS